MAASTAEAEFFESGHVAQLAGIAVETLRDWERRKVIAPPLKTASGRRLFRSEDVVAIRAIVAERAAARQARGVA